MQGLNLRTTLGRIITYTLPPGSQPLRINLSPICIDLSLHLHSLILSCFGHSVWWNVESIRDDLNTKRGDRRNNICRDTTPLFLMAASSKSQDSTPADRMSVIAILIQNFMHVNPPEKIRKKNKLASSLFRKKERVTKGKKKIRLLLLLLRTRKTHRFKGACMEQVGLCVHGPFRNLHIQLIHCFTGKQAENN